MTKDITIGFVTPTPDELAAGALAATLKSGNISGAVDLLQCALKKIELGDTERALEFAHEAVNKLAFALITEYMSRTAADAIMRDDRAQRALCEILGATQAEVELAFTLNDAPKSMAVAIHARRKVTERMEAHAQAQAWDGDER